MNSDPQGRFSFDVYTTSDNPRNDLYQTWGGRIVEWGGSENKIFGYPRFKANTMFTLNAKNETSGWITRMTSSPSMKLNPALSQKYKKDIYNLSFKGVIFDSEGNPVHPDYIVIITG